MILVKIKAGASKIHGLGLIADEFIPKGTKTFEYIDWFDTSFAPEDLEKMSEPARAQILWYAYIDKDTGRYHLCTDDQRFINHSSDPEKINIGSTPNYDIALKDIQPGEELLCNYNDFDDTYWKRHGIAEEDLI